MCVCVCLCRCLACCSTCVSLAHALGCVSGMLACAAFSAVHLTAFRHSGVCEKTFFVIPGANGNGASTRAQAECPTSSAGCAMKFNPRPPASTWKLLGPVTSERHELQQRAIHIPATGRPGVTFPFIRLHECMLEGYGNPKFLALVVRPQHGV